MRDTPDDSQPPQASASTNSATRACRREVVVYSHESGNSSSEVSSETARAKVPHTNLSREVSREINGEPNSDTFDASRDVVSELEARAAGSRS